MYFMRLDHLSHEVKRLIERLALAKYHSTKGRTDGLYFDIKRLEALVTRCTEMCELSRDVLATYKIDKPSE